VPKNGYGFDVKSGIVEIDGSFGEGGGQILRTSLSLASLTGRAVRVYNIRAGRKDAGLKPQHLLSAEAVRRITGGRLEGAGLGSQELFFYPGPLSSGRYIFDVAELKASAGSTGLVFQTVALPLSFARGGSYVKIKGGTHVEWSPPADYIKEVFLPVVARMGVRVEVNVPVKGFYPIGGGELDCDIGESKTPLKPLILHKRGDLRQVSILSTVANLPLNIARRQFERANQGLKAMGFEPEGSFEGVSSPGRGTFLFILARFENITAGFSALGRPGKRAEAVADEAVTSFASYIRGQGALDPRLADQAVLPMALASGTSTVTTTELTAHLTTNVWAIERFLPVRFRVEGEAGGKGTVRVKGAGFTPS
jgi:RNA 3'-terminal phosphate cyclase (ATP)